MKHRKRFFTRFNDPELLLKVLFICS